MNLSDMALVKDNHLALAGQPALVRAVRAWRRRKIPVEIEVDSLELLSRVLPLGADIIMLDNFSVENMSEAVRRIDGRFETEASGGITEKTLRTFAETGVDYISMGALTHQIKSLDMSLKAE